MSETKANVNWEELTDYWIRRYCETLEKNDELKARIEELEAQLDEADDNVCDAEYYRSMYANQCQEMDVLKESIKVRNEVIDNLQSTIRNLEAENRQVRELERSRDTWYKTSMRNHEDCQTLKRKIEDLETSREYYKTVYGETCIKLEKANADRTELSKAYDKLCEKNRNSDVRADVLHEEVLWYRKHYKELSDKSQELKKQLEELTSQYQKLTIENKRLQDSVRDTGYEEGQTDLWNMLQEVSNYYYFGSDDEFDTDDCDMTSMDDIIDVLDVNQFLEAYKNWQKKKEHENERTKYMREYVERFCIGRLCTRCPLHADGFTCGRNKWYFGVPDKDVERYYEKAIGCSQSPLKHKDD